MAPTDDSKWAMLRELAFARFPEDVEVADAMHRVEELAGQQPGDVAAFVAATEAVIKAEEEKRVGEVLWVFNGRARTVVGSRQAKAEAWALAATVAAHQEKEVMEVAEDAARETVACSRSPSTSPQSSLWPGLSSGRTTPPSTSSLWQTTLPWPRPTWLCHRSSPTRRTATSC
jgi:hypothetical protein